MVSDNPLDDPLTAAFSHSDPSYANERSPPPSWQRDHLFAPPFSAGWGDEAHGATSTLAWGDAAEPARDSGASSTPLENESGVPHDQDREEETFSDPTTTSPSPPADEPTSTLRSSALRTDAPSFAPTFSPIPAAAPIEMPSPPGSSLHRARSPSTSGILPSPSVSPSVTPRAVDSPLLRKISLEPSAVDDATPAPSPVDPPTPSPSSPLTTRPPPTRSASTASSSKGYEPRVLRNLISTACSNGDLDRLKSLLASNSGEDAFALANEASLNTGLAPLHYASQRGHVDVVQWLIEEAGAMAESEDLEGETPLHKAAHKGHLDVCRFLISRGVDVDAQDADGWTALHNASSRGWLDVAHLLVSAGASLNKPSRHAYTALQNAASKGQLPLVHYLLKQKAEPLLRNSFGETAYDLAAAVFEVQICTVLATAEAAQYMGEDSAREPYNPFDLHSTVPVVLYENQRLALPTLKKLSSLGGLTGGIHWTAKALSRNDARAAFSMPTLPGIESEDAELPCFRSEVGLPVVGKEGELILPERREIRSGGRVRATSSATPSSSPSTWYRTPRPATIRRKSSAASSSLSPVLAASSSSSPAVSPAAQPSNSSSGAASRGEPAFMWLSDWIVDTTSPSSSPIDGWSYAASFDVPADEWTPEPSLDVLQWVRRRRWVRVMRRRLDLPDWGFADLPPFPRRPSLLSAPPTPSASGTDRAQDASLGYRARAQFLAGNPHVLSTAGNASDRASVRSGVTVMADEVRDRAELKKTIARLEAAMAELRRGIVTDEDADSRRRAEDELEAFLHQLALVRAEMGTDDLEEEGDSDDEFIYSGRDAGDDDDARSVWTSTRPASVTSADDPHPPSSDYFAQPSSPTSEATSPYPDLTPQLARAPEFRVPTQETALSLRTSFSPSFQPRGLRPVWQPDEAAIECLRCSKRFSLFNRKHHCRRCGFVVCAACSQHQDQLDPHIVAIEPGSFMDDQPWLSSGPSLYRTCTDCHAALSLPHGLASASLLSPQAFFPASPSLGSVTPSEAAASDASELVECPVCGTTLAAVGNKVQQESHIRNCLEEGDGSIASGRYLVFKLPPGPLVNEECKICFDEFEIGDKMARLVCLCTFHEVCLSSWLSRGHSCPVHASRET
ncbi:hypothetical protein JCM11641_002241 [Rhodosporidiobolus odoratus]